MTTSGTATTLMALLAVVLTSSVIPVASAGGRQGERNTDGIRAGLPQSRPTLPTAKLAPGCRIANVCVEWQSGHRTFCIRTSRVFTC